jgi:hypothetical protein
MGRRPLLAVIGGGVAATALGLVAGQGGTVAVASALTLAAALAVVAALQLRPERRRRQSPPARTNGMPLRLRQIVDALRQAESSEVGVDRSLRPLLVPIAAARLGRRGVDLALAPERARELLGDRLWEVVRPDRPPGSYRAGPRPTGEDVQAAIERLEQL